MGEEKKTKGGRTYATGKTKYDISEVVLVFHGNWQGLRIDTDAQGTKHSLKTSTYCDPNNDISPSSLEKKEIGLLDLSSCNGGNVDHKTENIASAFVLSNSKIDKVEAWDGEASYGNDIFGNVVEKSDLSDDDQNDSKHINGFYRVAQQELIYSLDSNNQLQVSDFQLETDYLYTAKRVMSIYSYISLPYLVL